jgi:RNA polymerase sigma-70 factor (ECF subfamily)
MHVRIARLPGALVTADQDPALEREFDARLAECSTLAFRVAYSVLRQREDAEDVAQEALLRAHRRFGQLRDREKFRAWLVRMTWRLALDWQRSDRRRTHRERQAAPEAAVEAVTRDERAALVWQAIDRLPEKLRKVVVLAGIEGHDLREVGALLRIPEGTVKSRLFLARQRIKEWVCAIPNSKSR